MSRGRIILEKFGRRYLLKRVPAGEVTCVHCALQAWCLDDGMAVAPCMELSGDNNHNFEEIKQEGYEDNRLGKQQQQG